MYLLYSLRHLCGRSLMHPHLCGRSLMHPQESRNWPRDILSFMRPLMWTLGAFRPNVQLFELLSTWFYRHPSMSNYRASLTKDLEEPSLWSSIATAASEIHSCQVKLSGDFTFIRRCCFMICCAELWILQK